MKITFLGTGGDGGIPQINCRCINCRKALNNTRLRRLRSSLMVVRDSKMIVMDCGPDFRQQLLNANIWLKDIALIVITHLHFDHVNGLMELSTGAPYNTPLYTSEKNKNLLLQMSNISYLVKAGYARFVTPKQASEFGVSLFEIPHSKSFPTSAVIVAEKDKSVWYSPDISDITQEINNKLTKMSLVIFDSTFLNEDNLPAHKLGHITVENSSIVLSNLGRKVLYTHINHTEDQRDLNRYLEKFGFRLAHDMLSLEV